MAASSLVVLGRLAKPHGIRGEIRVDYYAESAELLEKPLMLRAGGLAPRPVRIKDWQLWKDQLILSIEGCNDRSAAERLRGQELLIDASFLPETEDDEPYLRDMIGLSVYLEDGTLVGELEDVDFPAGQEMWSIRSSEKDGGHEILFPAVPDFVVSIDISSQKAVIAPPEGLLELYGEESSSADDGKAEENAEDSSSCQV